LFSFSTVVMKQVLHESSVSLGLFVTLLFTILMDFLFLW
jgi:hypothetical protein